VEDGISIGWERSLGGNPIKYKFGYVVPRGVV